MGERRRSARYDELGKEAREEIKERGEAEADPESKQWEVVVNDTA